MNVYVPIHQMKQVIMHQSSNCAKAFSAKHRVKIVDLYKKTLIGFTFDERHKGRFTA